MGVKGLGTIAVVYNAVVAEAVIPVAVIDCEDNLAALGSIEGPASGVAAYGADIYAPVGSAAGIRGIARGNIALKLNGPGHFTIVFIGSVGGIAYG